LDKFGYEYVTLDAGWFGDETVHIDQWGRPIADPSLFPTTAPGGNLAPFVDKVNSIGFKVGLWYMGGVPMASYQANSPIKGTSYHVRDIVIPGEVYCPRWDPGWGYNIDHKHPGAQAWYDSLVELWNQWGVSMIKLDCVNSEDESFPHRLDIIALHSSFSSLPNEFVFSLSPGGFANVSQMLDIAPFVTMARGTDDFWDNWQFYMNSGGGDGASSGFSHWDSARDLAAVVRNQQPTFWVDLDMLPLGRIGHEGSSCSSVDPGCPRYDRFTTNEKQSIISLWALIQSPLIIGGDQTDKNVLPLLTAFFMNDQILELTDYAYEQRESLRVNSTNSQYIVWQASSTRSSATSFLAIFNLFNITQKIEIPWNFLGMSVNCSLTNFIDLWKGIPAPCDDTKLSVSLGQHGVQLLKVEN